MTLGINTYNFYVKNETEYVEIKRKPVSKKKIQDSFYVINHSTDQKPASCPTPK